MSDLVYVLQRRNWNWARTSSGDRSDRLVRLPGVVRLRTFADEDEAREECAALEERARRKVNPFLCGGPALHHQTSFAEGIFCDWLLDAGLQPPKVGKEGRDWVWWWKVTGQNLNELQWAHVWHALDRLVFHEVIARPPHALAYVVARIDWQYDDESFTAMPGSAPVRVFRTRERAEVERQSLEEEERERYTVEDYNDTEYPGGFFVESRRDERDPLGVADDDETDYNDPAAPFFFEVIEVELDQFHGGRA